MRSDVMLWLYLLAGPLVWFVSLEANFALAPLASQAKLALDLISLAALAITAVLAYVAWTSRRRFSDDAAANGGSGSRIALSMAAVVLNIMFFVVILAQSLPNFVSKGSE